MNTLKQSLTLLVSSSLLMALSFGALAAQYEMRLPYDPVELAGPSEPDPYLSGTMTLFLKANTDGFRFFSGVSPHYGGTLDPGEYKGIRVLEVQSRCDNDDLNNKNNYLLQVSIIGTRSKNFFSSITVEDLGTFKTSEAGSFSPSYNTTWTWYGCKMPETWIRGAKMRFSIEE